MGVLTPAERDVEHTVQPHVVHELRPAGEEPGVLVAWEAGPENRPHVAACSAARRTARTMCW